MSDQQEKLIENNGTVYEGKNYRVSSNTAGGAMQVEQIIDEAKRKAAAAERLASIGD